MPEQANRTFFTYRVALLAQSFFMSIKQKILLVVSLVLAVNVTMVLVLVMVPAGDTEIVLDAQEDATSDTVRDDVLSEEAVSQVPLTGEREAKNVPFPEIQEVSVGSAPEQTTQEIIVEGDKVVVPVYTEGTVLDAMRAFEATGAFRFGGKEYTGLGFFVEEVQGVTPLRGRYWILYVNGEKAGTGVSEARVLPGDTIEWRIEKSM